MNESWKQHLERDGAVFANGIPVHFGEPEQEMRSGGRTRILADLSYLGLIAVRGEEAQTFLQGQLSNDIRQVDADHSQLSAYCSPKGRMLAGFRIFMREEAYYLALPAELLDATLKRLRMFVLRSKVTLEDASDVLSRFGLAGPDADTVLRAAVDAIPERDDEVRTVGALSVIRVPGVQPRFEIHGAPAPVAVLWQTLRAGGARPVGTGQWRLLDIAAGLPSIHPATVDAFVPQMVNLQAIGGVSFKKGCYPGQEVVARMQYLGKLKRRMYRAHVDSAAPPQPGDELFAPTDADQSAGKVVEAQASPDGGYELLAVIQIASAEAGDIRLGRADGPRLELETLPYALDSGLAGGGETKIQ